MKGRADGIIVGTFQEPSFDALPPPAQAFHARSACASLEREFAQNGTTNEDNY